MFSRLCCAGVGMLLAAVALHSNAAQAPADPLKRTTPSWFDEAKLGIFVHWNAASIPAFAAVTSRAALGDNGESGKDRKIPYAEMYQLPMMIPGSAVARYHAEHYGTMPYDGFVTQFRDEMIPGWDPKAWATFFARAGARYVVFATRTEDGFLMWPSAHRHPRKEGWQSPRDVVGDLAAAVRAEGLRFGTYYTGGVDWTFAGLTPPSREVPATEEYRAYVDAHWRELIERYKPDVIWNDYAYPSATKAKSRKLESTKRKQIEDLFRFYLARVPDGVINDRFDGDAQSSGKLYVDFATVEYRTEPKTYHLKWEVCRGMGTSFGYNAYEDEESYMSADELIRLFVDIVARGGNLLINVGPMSTGEIPWLQARPLLELGWWLRTNGEAIYGTHPWVRSRDISGEGHEIRYTAAKDAVFAILLGTPRTRTVELDLKLDPQTTVGLEGWGGTLKWRATPSGVRIELPVAPDQRPAWSLRFSPQTGVHPFAQGSLAPRRGFQSRRFAT